MALSIPPLAVGIFSLRNVKFSFGLTIPFDGQKISFRYAVSERHDPFIVAVGIFGGGGFFEIELFFTGEIKSLEASIEFGGTFALDIGIAKGSVYLMAGIYFSLSGTQMTFEGYLRCGGSVNVLGIISVSVELYLGFGYKKDRVAHQAVIYGIARVTVEISILFFSKTVTLEYEKDYVQAVPTPTSAK